MRRVAVFVLVLLSLPSAYQAFSQDRYLLTPFGEAIPIEKGKSAVEVMKAHGLPEGVMQPCPTSVPVGVYDPTGSNGNTNFGYAGKDVAAMVFITPASGIIESLYFWAYQANSIPDSTAYVRIMSANTSGYGNSPTWFGYCPDSLDPEGRTPYPDEATGPCFAPVDTPEIWGLGGFPMIWRTGPLGVLNSLAMSKIGGYEAAISAGDSFFVCIRTGPPTGGRTEMLGYNSPQVPFRFFKYYHLDRLPGQPGWWSREFDMLIWVVVRVTDDLPPIIENLTALNHTLSTDSRTICLNAFDCNPASPPDTGVANAWLFYSVNGGPWDSVALVETDSGGVRKFQVNLLVQ